MRLKNSIFFFLLFLNLQVAVGQLSHGGKPSSYESETPAIILPPVPAETKAFSSGDFDRVTPLQFAYPFKVDYSCDKDGEWFSLPGGGRLWRIRIKSEGAFSLNVIFDRFKIPEGGEVFIYSPDKSTVLGAFTYLNNKPSGVLAVAPVPGDEIIIEYKEERAVSGEPELVIGSVNHDYLGVQSFLSEKKNALQFGGSGSCNVNVNCSDFTPDTIQRSVCKIIVDGTTLCTGTLINNTRNDGTPYFITAAHCLTSENSDKSIIFYFNYESPDCRANIEGPREQTLSGSTLKAQVDTLDFALVEIDDMPPATYRPYWVGWELSTAPSKPFVTIHHPQGDVKKISLDNEDIVATTFNASTPDGDPFVKDAHWWVKKWDAGTTEGGSSGAGLFDANAHLVGTLSGGQASCDNSINDYFARLNKYWNYLSTDTLQVAHWLDPDNTGATQLNGFDYYHNECKRLSHLTKADTIVLLEGDGLTGYWSGHNSLGISDYAEYYSGIVSADINALYLVSGQRIYSGTDDSIKIKIWSGDYSGPDVLLAEKSFPVSPVRKNREYYLEFDQPVSVTNSFFAGIEFEYGTTATDTLALYQIENKGSGTNSNEYGFLFYGSEWKRLSEVNPSGVKGNYWIDVLASNVKYTPVHDNVSSDDDLIIYPNPVEKGRLYFKTDNHELRYVGFYNIGGERVLYHKVEEGTGSGYIDIPFLTKGIYIAKFVFKNKTISRKVLLK